jgi:hypothetical protein
MGAAFGITVGSLTDDDDADPLEDQAALSESTQPKRQGTDTTPDASSLESVGLDARSSQAATVLGDTINVQSPNLMGKFEPQGEQPTSDGTPNLFKRQLWEHSLIPTPTPPPVATHGPAVGADSNSTKHSSTAPFTSTTTSSTLERTGGTAEKDIKSTGPAAKGYRLPPARIQQRPKTKATNRRHAAGQLRQCSRIAQFFSSTKVVSLVEDDNVIDLPSGTRNRGENLRHLGTIHKTNAPETAAEVKALQKNSKEAPSQSAITAHKSTTAKRAHSRKTTMRTYFGKGVKPTSVRTSNSKRKSIISSSQLAKDDGDVEVVSETIRTKLTTYNHTQLLTIRSRSLSESVVESRPH